MRMSDWCSDVCASDLTIIAEAMDRSGMGLATLASAAGQRAAVPPLREPVTPTMADMGMGAMDGANGGAFSHDTPAGMPVLEQGSGPGGALDHCAMGHFMLGMLKLPPGSKGRGGEP